MLLEDDDCPLGMSPMFSLLRALQDALTRSLEGTNIRFMTGTIVEDVHMLIISTCDYAQVGYLPYPRTSENVFDLKVSYICGDRLVLQSYYRRIYTGKYSK